MLQRVGKYLLNSKSLKTPELSNTFYNTSFTLDSEGNVLAKHRKTHLFDIDIPGKITFKESETLTAGDTVTSFDYKNGVKFGVGICYDIRFPEMALSMRYDHGTERDNLIRPLKCCEPRAIFRDS